MGFGIVTGDIERWADVAMWSAPPISEERPKVRLISMTPNPLKVMAAAAELYRGNVVDNPADIHQGTALHWLREMGQTRLAAPLEFVDLHFLLEGVTRAFTHQLVRQRTAVYIQESMRFAVKESAATEVGLPPSLAGLKPDDPRVKIWTDAVGDIDEAYNRLVAGGMPAEDARGLLPTNILTRVHYKTNLRNLAEHAGNRLCTQAQFEWRQVWAKMIQAIQDRPREMEQWGDAWQYDAIADMFRPICYLTGKCEFMGDNDRYCRIRERVQAHHGRAEPSEEWNDISPVEWLADPTAARQPR
jgi:flavin-dependent thymidylate synthase